MHWGDEPVWPGAASADEAVRTMARTVSHELGQPLTVLLGLLELWERGHFPRAHEATLRAELEQVAHELADRVQSLTAAQRYVTREFGGCVLLDLVGARLPTGTP
jgi:signal transduction histidine kinase